MSLRSRLAGALTVGLLSFGVPVLASAPAAHAGCASGFHGYITGYISGADKRYVDSFIGFDLLTSTRQKVGMDGCPTSGYSVTTRVNNILPSTGSTSSTYNGTTLTNQFHIWNVPDNVRIVYIEAYPKAADNSCCGTTDHTRYGNAMKGQWTYSTVVTQGNVQIHLPVICSAGGNTGSIMLNAPSSSISRVGAWSGAQLAPGNGFPQGWNVANNTNWLRYLASGQSYTLLVTTTSGVHHTYYGVQVNACATTYHSA